MAELFSSAGIGFGIAVCVSTILTALVTPVYYSVMYFDLRARRGEFLPAPDAGVDAQQAPLL